MDVGEPLVQARALIPRFAATDYISDTLDLDIYDDSLTCVVGPDSSGKSHYLRALAGIDPPAAGSLRLLGRDLGTIDRQAWRGLRAEVGYLGPATALLSNLDGLENVMLPALYHRKGDPARIHAAAEALLQTIGGRGYTGVLPAYMREIQRRKLAVARVLLLEPRVLFLDNPFRSLDMLAAAELNELLRRRMCAPGLALVMATEELSYAEEHGARILFVSRGRVSAFDDLAALRRSGFPEVTRFLGMLRQAG